MHARFCAILLVLTLATCVVDARALATLLSSAPACRVTLRPAAQGYMALYLAKLRTTGCGHVRLGSRLRQSDDPNYWWLIVTRRPDGTLAVSPPPPIHCSQVFSPAMFARPGYYQIGRTCFDGVFTVPASTSQAGA